MGRRLFLVVLLLAAAVTLRADTLTPNIFLTKPTHGSPDWDTKINGDLDIVDARLAGTLGTSAVPATRMLTAGACIDPIGSLLLDRTIGITASCIGPSLIDQTGTYTWSGAQTFNGATTFSGATTFGGTETHNGPSTFVGAATFNAGKLLDKGEIVCDVKAYGATGNGSTDDTAAIKLALAACGNVTGSVAGRGTIFFPPGTYLVSSALPVTRDSIIAGAGMEATTIKQGTTPPGFSVFQVVQPRTCTLANAGSCDARIGTNGRGGGCVCHTTADCVTTGGAVCSGGTRHGFAKFKDFKITLNQDNSVGIDFLGLDSAMAESLTVICGGTHTNEIGMLFSDGGQTVSDYENTILNVSIGGCDVGARVMAKANDQRFDKMIFSLDTTGLVVENTIGTTHINDTMWQLSTAAVCGAPCTALTCCGGYFHGKTCAVAADCGEADLILLGNTATVMNPRFESTVPHIRLGENSTPSAACPTCGAFQAQGNAIINQNDVGTGKSVTEVVGKSSLNFFLDGTTTDQTVMVHRTPLDLRTVHGAYLDQGRPAWWWQTRDQDAADTMVDAIGMASPAVTGTASKVADATGYYVNYVSAGAGGNLAGWTAPAGSYNWVQFQQRPGFNVCFKTDAAQTTSLRYWLGIFSAAPDASATPALSYSAFRFDSATDTNGNWRACQDSGSGTPTCTDTGIAYAVDTRFCFSMDSGTLAVGGVRQPTYYIDGAIVASMSTTLPGATTALHGVAEVVETNATPKSIRLQRFTGIASILYK